MKRRIIFAAISILMTQLVSSAAITVEQTMSKEYLMNNGYSKQIYNTANVGRARALGKEFYTSEELELKNKTTGWKILRKIQAYIDPAIDDYSFYHHDISPEPNVNDL